MDKLAVVRGKMKESMCFAYIVSALDDIAWIYNIRGSDVPLNPYVRSYAIITLEKAFIFVDTERPGIISVETLYHVPIIFCQVTIAAHRILG